MSELQPIGRERKSKLAQVRELVNREQDRGMLSVIGQTKTPTDRDLLHHPLSEGQIVQSVIYVSPKSSLHDLNYINRFADDLAKKILHLVDRGDYYNNRGKIDTKSGGLLIPQIKLYEKVATTQQVNITATTGLVDDFIEPTGEMDFEEREQVKDLDGEISELISETGTSFTTLRETAVYVYPTDKSARKAYEHVKGKQQEVWDEEAAVDKLKENFTGSIFQGNDGIVPVFVKIPS
jgi:hypothetical protein